MTCSFSTLERTVSIISAISSIRSSLAPRRKYSWELEEEEAERQALLDAQFEPARPDEVPVLWQHGEHAARDGRNVLPFRRTDD